MGYNEVGGAKTYIKWSECKKGQVVLDGAKYRRSFEGKYGIQYEFVTDDGEIIVINKSGQLDYKMDFIRPGSKVHLTYEGKIVLDKGKYKDKESNQFTLLCDDDFKAPDDSEQEAATQDAAGIDDFGDL
jgi:hypothetical protein